MTIHSEHPFATPPERREAVRQLRGRLTAPVTLWASGAGAGRVGLTVSSLLVGQGETDRVIGLIDPDSDFALDRGETIAISLLLEGEHGIADVFAGLAPAPGGGFRAAEFLDTGWGPVLAGERSWCGVRVESSRELGWSSELVCVVEHVEVAGGATLLHQRGRYGGFTG